MVEGCAHRETDTGSAQLKLGQTGMWYRKWFWQSILGLGSREECW